MHLSVSELAQGKNVTPAFNFNRKYEKLASVVHVLQNAQNLIISRCFLQRTAKKCTKFYNARAQPFFCSGRRSRSRCRPSWFAQGP